jgi:hypothetical protein
MEFTTYIFRDEEKSNITKPEDEGRNLGNFYTTTG